MRCNLDEFGKGECLERHDTNFVGTCYCANYCVCRKLCEIRDSVNHPKHYTSHPSGIECIDIVEYMPFNIGNAIKYLWRAGLKDPNWREDMEKAMWYINREIKRKDEEKGN